MLSLSMLVIEPAGTQRTLSGDSFELYNVYGAEEFGIANGSTVSRLTLQKAGIEEYIDKQPNNPGGVMELSYNDWLKEVKKLWANYGGQIDSLENAPLWGMYFTDVTPQKAAALIAKQEIINN